jgi:FlaA1/EpsC-like NDP-sugar epimerase
LKKRLLSSSRLTKQFLAGFVDFNSILAASIFAIVISNISLVNLSLLQRIELIWIPFSSIVLFYLAGVYKSVLRYIDVSDIYSLLRAIIIVLSLNLLIRFFVIFIADSFFQELSLELLEISTEGWMVAVLSIICLVIGSRLFANYYFLDNASEKRVVIYGAGSAGIQLAGALRVSKEMQPVAFLDQNPVLHNTSLGGIKVLHPKKLKKLVTKNKVDEVLIAMPSASKSTLRNLLKEIEAYSIKVRVLPGLAALAQGEILVSELKEVDISDLLGRLEVEANQNLLDKNIKDKVVLITGAGGSIGSEISRQVSRNKASKVILLDTNEYALYSIKNEIENLLPKTELYAVLGSVTNKRRITEVCKAFAVDTVYHAAAYKHVPIVEENPFEGVFNNIIGTQACVQAAIDAEVETFVLISTDKAVRPTNIMGATKRFSEMILQSLSTKDDIKNKTRITMVRFGNVIGSSGSAIPLFQQQIKEGGPVTVTDPEVVRYFMSIPEAAELVIQAGAMGKGGDVFVLDMGEPIKIYDLAKRLISLSGMELKDKDNPEGDIEIIFTGLRPGEKLYEELLIGDNVSTTEHKRILRAEEDFLTTEELEKHLNLLKKAEKKGDVVALKETLKEVVSGFTSENEIVDVVHNQKQK